MKVSACGYICQSRKPPMSKKLNIFPGIGFFLRNSAAAKENLCSVSPIPYSRGENEKESVAPPKTASAPTIRAPIAVHRENKREGTAATGSRKTDFPLSGFLLFPFSFPFSVAFFAFPAVTWEDHAPTRSRKPV